MPKEIEIDRILIEEIAREIKLDTPLPTSFTLNLLHGENINNIKKMYPQCKQTGRAIKGILLYEIQSTECTISLFVHSKSYVCQEAYLFVDED